MSLSLPPSFARTSEAMASLRSLLATLSTFYVVTLIAPPPQPHSDDAVPAEGPTSNGTALFDNEEDEDDMREASKMADSQSGGGVASVAALAESLKDIDGFNEHRVLEYERPEGRMALGRALACDAHVEVLISQSDLNERKETNDELDTGDDGESTPRAGTPVLGNRSAPLSRKQGAQSQKDEDSLEKYHTGLEQLRKSTGVLVMLALPPLRGFEPSSRAKQHAASTLLNGTGRSGVNESSPATILERFHSTSGVKIIDCRGDNHFDSAASSWKDAAEKLVELRNGWK